MGRACYTRGINALCGASFLCLEFSASYFCTCQASGISLAMRLLLNPFSFLDCLRQKERDFSYLGSVLSFS
jgi:hypothetical protein